MPDVSTHGGPLLCGKYVSSLSPPLGLFFPPSEASNHQILMVNERSCTLMMAPSSGYEKRLILE